MNNFPRNSIGILGENIDFYFIQEPHNQPYMQFEKLEFNAIEPCKLTKNTSMKRWSLLGNTTWKSSAERNINVTAVTTTTIPHI